MTTTPLLTEHSVGQDIASAAACFLGLRAPFLRRASHTNIDWIDEVLDRANIPHSITPSGVLESCDRKGQKWLGENGFLELKHADFHGFLVGDIVVLNSGAFEKFGVMVGGKNYITNASRVTEIKHLYGRDYSTCYRHKSLLPESVQTKINYDNGAAA